MRFFCLLASVGSASPPWKHVASTDDGIVVRARIDKKRGQGETLAKGLIEAPIVGSVLVAEVDVMSVTRHAPG